MDNNKVSFKDFLVNYDEKQDEFIQYRRRKFRRTDTTSESTQMDEISKNKLYTYYKKSYDDETERRGDAIAQKRNLTPDEKRKNANRKAYRKKAASLITPKPKKVSDAGKSGQRPDGSDERMKFRKAFKQAQNESVESVLKEYFGKVHPALKKELGAHGDHATGMAGSDKGVAVSFDRPKDVNALRKQMAQHGYKNVTQMHDTTGKHKHVYHFQESNENPVDSYLASESVEEALTIAQRRKKAIQMKKLKGKIKIGQERARRRVASNQKLLKRARKHARMALFKKLSKGQGKADIDYARREAIEKRLDKMKGKIDMLAKKLLPSIRKAELSKRQKKK